MPRLHRSAPRLAAWFLALAAACSGASPEALSEARLQIERGELERAAAALEGASGTEADALREKIDAGLRRRAEIEKTLKNIADGALAHDAGWSTLKFNALLQEERDPRNLERITQAIAEVTARVEKQRRSPQPPAGAKPGPVAPSAAATRAHDAAQLARAALAEARTAQGSREWKAALSLAQTAADDAASAPEARELQREILTAARIDAEAVVARARELEGSGQLAQAARWFRGELSRFPVLEEFESFRYESQLLTERASGAAPVAAAARARPAEPKAPSALAHDKELARAASPDECEALAKYRADHGDLKGARDAWLEAARRKSQPAWKEESERRARELDLRLALREELADFARVDEETARVLGTKGAADDGGGRRFEAVPLSEIARLVERDRLSKKARLGFLIESIVRGDEREREQALEGLGASVARREFDASHASSLVAQAKGELGEGGWVFRGGHWLEGKVAKAEDAADQKTALGAQYAQLTGEFRRASALERDGVLAQLRAVGDPELLADALSKRWQDDWERLEKNPNLRQIAQIGESRRALDAAREKALALIFDEERYFYPYNPPECPPDKAAKYAGVQREVDELVGAVHAIWEVPKRVKIGDALRGELADAAWTSARATEFGIETCKTAPEWRFAFVLPAGEDVGLADFAWDAAERAALTESDKIEARNERLWTALDHAKPADDVPSSDEMKQVRVTNAYRRMLGRRALAWNPKLEAAAQGHSDYMANTGNFGHFEEGNPARRTPFDRMKLAGYGQNGVSENCSMGRGDPQSAHEGWTHSSGHHRNLLMPGHREMASAIASSYWTQNFGVDSAFQSDL